MSTKTTGKPKEYFVSLDNLHKVTAKNLIVKPPVTNISKEGHSWVTSSGNYKDLTSGEIYDEFLFQGPPQQVFGINGKWGDIPEADRTLDNIEGLQVCYPMTSLETMKEPTAHEKAFMKLLKDGLWKSSWDAMVKFDDAGLIDGPAGSSCTTAQKRKNPEYAMKPMFAFAAIKDKTGKKTGENTSKPQRMYVDLVTIGKGQKMKCLTPIYGPGDKKVSWMKYFSTDGNWHIGTIEPVFRWKQDYWGAHGPTSTHGGSVKLEIVEMNFTPKSARKLEYGRMLPRNEAVEEKSGDEGSEEGGNTSFKNPMGGGTINEDDFDGPQDENVSNLLGKKGAKNNTNEKEEGDEGDDAQDGNDDDNDGEPSEDEEEKARKEAEEEDKRKAKVKAEQLALKKARVAERKAAAKK